MNRRVTGIVVAATLFAIVSAPIAGAADMTLVREPTPWYNGTLRIYVVEPTSRWKDDDNHNFGFGFLDFALVTELAIPDMSTHSQSVVWDADVAGWDNVVVDNIMAIAAVFNEDSVQLDAYPGHSYYFWAHFVDAAAGATPGNPGLNTVNEDFSHTVFVEEAGSPT